MEFYFRHFLAVAALGCGALVGCGHSKPPPRHLMTAEEAAAMPHPQTSTQWQVTPITPPPRMNLPVKEGPAPMAYIVELPANLRVVDMTDGAVLVSTVTPRARVIVSIDPQNGITVAGQKYINGPLPIGRRYGIYLDENGPNEYRNAISGPGGAMQNQNTGMGAPVSPPADRSGTMQPSNMPTTRKTEP
jgi:hypothetical protein